MSKSGQKRLALMENLRLAPRANSTLLTLLLTAKENA
jgi:hypothetical protein